MSDSIKRRTSPVTPTGLNHLVLNVRDIEESHHFWCDLLGFEQVGQMQPRAAANLTMRFYSGVGDGVSHHDLALVEQPGMPGPADWDMYTNHLAVNHIAITYPDRESWLEQVRFLKDQGVTVNLRIDHGMTHSVYLSDPNGYGVEVLYELPPEVWQHDIDGALNYAVVLPPEDALHDDTDYETDFQAWLQAQPEPE